MKSILIGYEVGTGKPVEIAPKHLVISGLTQESGKTTTLEALLHRSEMKALVFKTKPGEKTNFAGGQMVAPYYRESSDWEYVASLLEATMKERMKFERSWIIDVCKGTSSLLDALSIAFRFGYVVATRSSRRTTPSVASCCARIMNRAGVVRPKLSLRKLWKIERCISTTYRHEKS